MSDSERNASRTARMVAAYRGRSSEGAEAVCDDPWALALAGEDGLKTADAYERYFPHMQLWLGLRTRFLDDLVVRAIAAGCTQIVLLGAGLDTRAARFGRPGVVFYEVDLPASQSDKRARLAALSGYPIEAATYVACDFERDDFLERLEAEGFRSDVPAVFVWEGVTYYLNEPAVRATAHRVAEGCHPRSQLVFDYIMERMGRGENLRPADQDIRGFVAKLGEPIRFGMNDPLPLLLSEGFRHVRTISFDQIAASYLGTYDRKREFRYQHIGLATRAPLESPWGV